MVLDVKELVEEFGDWLLVNVEEKTVDNVRALSKDIGYEVLLLSVDEKSHELSEIASENWV